MNHPILAGNIWRPAQNAAAARTPTSRITNRIDYAGYQHAPKLAGTKWHVRWRVLLSDLGIWASADPLDYVDGPNRYQYARSHPLVGVDPTGLACWLQVDCTLTSQSELDKCTNMCQYSCTEVPNSRHTRKGFGGCDPGFQCDDMRHVPPITMPRTTTTSNLSCRCTGIGSAPDCPASFRTTISIEGFNCYENCVTADCLKTCQEIHKAAKDACKLAPNKALCHIAADAALEGCRSYCETFCKELIDMEDGSALFAGENSFGGGECAGCLVPAEPCVIVAPMD